MRKAIGFTQNSEEQQELYAIQNNFENIRRCPQCELMTLKGMPGGADSTCKNCGYKDPCCSD